MTQADIAEKVGISKQAVAHALSDRPELRRKLGDATRRRVLETAAAMGYVPDRAARRLARARFGANPRAFEQVALIALGASSLDGDPVCLSMMAGAEYELSRVGAMLSFVRIAEPGDWERLERLIRAGTLDAALLYGPTDDQVMHRLSQLDMRCVIVGDHRCAAEPVFAANVDNAAVARLAVEHLAALGHCRVAFLGSSTQFAYQREIRQSFRAAIEQFNLDPDERLIADSEGWLGSIVASSLDVNHRVHVRRVNAEFTTHAVRWLHEVHPKPTAIFAPELNWAAFVHDILNAAKFSVPGEISIVGFETPAIGPLNQDYTRVEMSMGEVGRAGAKLLHRLVFEPQLGPCQWRVAPSLVQGWSTAPPPQRTD